MSALNSSSLRSSSAVPIIRRLLLFVHALWLVSDRCLKTRARARCRDDALFPFARLRAALAHAREPLADFLARRLLHVPDALAHAPQPFLRGVAPPLEARLDARQPASSRALRPSLACRFLARRVRPAPHRDRRAAPRALRARLALRLGRVRVRGRALRLLHRERGRGGGCSRRGGRKPMQADASRWPPMARGGGRDGAEAGANSETRKNSETTGNKLGRNSEQTQNKLGRNSEQTRGSPSWSGLRARPTRSAGAPPPSGRRRTFMVRLFPATN